MPMKCPWCEWEGPYSEYIMHMDEKHPGIVGKELARPTTDQVKKDFKPVNLTPEERQKLHSVPALNLNNMMKEEEQGIREYEELLSRINSLKGSLDQIVFIELIRRLNRILQEERAHLDILRNLQEMIQT